MKKYFYLLMMIVCMGFVSCGDDSSNDNEEGNPSTQESKNADLLGWWIESDGAQASSLSPNKSCWALHFIDGNVFEFAVLVIKESSYDSSYSTEDVGKHAFTYKSVDYYFSKQNNVKSYIFEREENTLFVKNVSYDPYLFIMNGKIRWTDVEYVKTAIK